MSILFKNFGKANWIKVGIIFILAFLQVYFMMRIIVYVGEITTAVQMSRMYGTDPIWEKGIYMIVCAILMAAVEILLQFFASSTSSSAVTRLRSGIYNKVNKLSLSDLAQFSTESLITRTTNDIQNTQLALIFTLKTIFIAPICIGWSIIALIKYVNLELTLAIAVWTFVLVATVIVLVLLLIPRFKIVQKMTDQLNVVSRENVTGVRVVRAFNAEEYQEKKFSNVNDKFTKLQVFTGRVLSLFSPVIMLVMFGLVLSILWISAYFLNGQDYELALEAFGATNSFVMLAGQIVFAFIILIALVVLIPRANVCLKRIKEVMDFEESIKDPEKSKGFKEEGTIEFKNVDFSYPEAGSPAVKNINFKVKKGETLAFIGATGSGKTTVINMIPRMADCTKGEVLVNGTNVKDVTQNELRNVIGYVPQKAFLFQGNIKENIAFGIPGIDMEGIEKAAEVAEAKSFIEDKDEKYDSYVAQGGNNFSGGQKQRLCIARAVAKNPEILIFDDSFSALDYKTDKLVRKNIEEANPNVTRVIVAQRVGTIMDADQIVVLDKGEIVGLGKHEDLVRNCDVYQEIALSQLSKEELGL